MTADARTPLIVTLYSRPGCHLCEVMKATVLEVAGRLPLTVQDVDVSSDPVLTARYGEDVPVLTAGDTEIARHRATVDELVERLTRAARSSPPYATNGGRP